MPNDDGGGDDDHDDDDDGDLMKRDALASNDPKSGDYGVSPPDLSWRLGFVVFWWLFVSLLRSDFIG
jgi:hypothetical protein